MFNEARYQRFESTVSLISQDGPSSSSLCSQWFLKYRKYILVSLVAGLSLAVILARGLALTTTTEKGMPFPKLVVWNSDELNYFSLNCKYFISLV